MSEQCQIFQEKFPLFHIKRLDAEQSALIAQHLEQCAECRALYVEELLLMELAANDSASILLTDHPENDKLVAFANSDLTLTNADFSEVEQHLQHCSVCSELVTHLKSLPELLENLVSEEHITTLTALSQEAASYTRAPVVRVARKVLWKRMIGYAAAAAVILVGVVFGPFGKNEVSPTSLEITVPSGMRSVGDSLIFVSPTPSTIANLSYFVSPESGHTYDVELFNGNTGKRLWSIVDFRDFDSKGYLKASMTLDTGTFEFVIRDIASADTVVYRRRFDIRTK